MAMEGREAVSVLLPASFEQLPMPAQLGGRNAEFQRKSPVDAVMRHGPRTERFALLRAGESERLVGDQTLVYLASRKRGQEMRGAAKAEARRPKRPKRRQ